MKNIFLTLSVVFALATSGVANAVPTPYSPIGMENAAVYTFTAATTGDLIGYFAGSTASYTNVLSMSVNGNAAGPQGLNSSTSQYGDSFNFGQVNAGDVLVFILTNIVPGGVGPWYSDTSLNSDSVNHVYSNMYAGDDIIGPGTFITFEDLVNGGNFNYDDISFVFNNVATSVPEPASIALLGFGIIGLALSRRKNGSAR